MRIADFDFTLPPELIAQNPAEPRDSARLLVYNRLSGEVTHATVREIGKFLPKEAVLVANNSRVRHSRLHGYYQSKPIEVLVLEPVEATTYRCLIRGKHIPIGAKLHFDFPLEAEVVTREEGVAMTTVLITFSADTDIETALARYGEVPLPPYITGSTSEPERYQTVFAKDTGSAAAPTAGLHFTPELIADLEKKDHPWLEVTLHVGLGTFLPLRKEEVKANELHKESTHIDEQTTELLNQVIQKKQPIITVGTTSTRTLEAHSRDGKISPGWQDTNLFIYPGYTFQSISGMLTNFHLPKSSLLVLVAALLANHPQKKEVVITEEDAINRLHKLYAIAIQERYRFYSFGDAMLII